MEEKVDILKRLRRLRRFSYEKAAMRSPYRVDRGIAEYLAELPKFYNGDLIRLLKEKLKEGGEVSILDVGCGQGIFLAELLKKFPQAKVYGVSGRDDRKDITDPKLRDLAYRIDYRAGDIQKLKALFPNEKFDFITSVATFMYLGDPLNVMRQCYGLLKPEGIVLIDSPGLYLSQEDKEKLWCYWKDQGIDSQMVPCLSAPFKDPYETHKIMSFNLAIKKGPPTKLPMPFRYTKPSAEDPRDYKLDESLM